MSIFNPKDFRPRRDWISVLVEPRKKSTSGGIILTDEETGVEKVDEGVGRIIRIGPSAHKAKHCGLEPGLRVVFRGFIKYANKFVNISSDEKWEDGTPKHYFTMDIEDIHLVVMDGVDIGVFSGRPQVPARSKS